MDLKDAFGAYKFNTMIFQKALGKIAYWEITEEYINTLQKEGRILRREKDGVIVVFKRSRKERIVPDQNKKPTQAEFVIPQYF